MAGTQGMKKKEDIASIINSILDQAAKTRRGFTPDVVQEFYDEGRRAREQRPAEQRREELIRESTPSRQLGNIVARRREETEQRTLLSPHMSQRAVEAAVDLGERIELAAQGRRLSLREWVTG